MGDHAGAERRPGSPASGAPRPGERSARLRVLALRTGLALVLLCVLTAMVVVAWLGRSGDVDAARTVSLLVSGGFAVVLGAALVVWTGRHARTHPTRALLSLSSVAWGLGQLLIGRQSLVGDLRYPAPGDLVSSVAVPLVLVGVILAPRRSSSRYPSLRLALDSLGVAIAVTFAFWRVTGGRSAAPDSGQVVGTLIFELMELTVLSMVSLAAIRDVRSRLWVGALGVFAQVTSDLIIALAIEPGGQRMVPWIAGVLSCVSWPLISLGVVLYRGRRSGPDGIEEDRDASAATTATMVLTVALICGVAFGTPSLFELEPMARGALVLIAALGPVLCAREVLGARMRLQLTAGLREQAFRDGLTGLLNRRALTHRIAGLDDDRPWVVLTLNLDGFKRVNDLLGPKAGDDLLIAVAASIDQGLRDTTGAARDGMGGARRRLTRRRPTRRRGDRTSGVSGSGSLAARIGGDEFAVLTPGDLEDGRRLAESLRTQAGAALAAGAPGLATGLSVGVGRLVRRHDTPYTASDQLSALVESAAALRAAKARGRGSVEIYAGAVADAHERRIRVEARLKHAIRSGAIRTHAQPVVRLDNGQLTGFEALARWDDEELGPVSPVEFIDVAEQTGMVVELGAQLLQATLEDARAAGVFEAGLTVAVNASPIQLRVPGFVDAIRYQLARCRVRPEQVVIEVTEAILVADDDPAVGALGELTLLGVGVAIDDFGTGYSALGYLRRLPVKVLKVDRSLTTSLLTEAKTVAIVEGVVRMAHRMGIRVVMEGIENELQADSCRAIGADQGQGWLFGRPVPWQATTSLVREAARAQDERRRTATTWRQPITPRELGDTWG